MLCAGALLAGCSTNSDSEPTAGSGGDSAPTVDATALDTGSYPTSPAPEFPRATTDNIIEVEGQRLAEFTVVPFEIDPALVSGKMPTMVMRSGKNIGAVIGNGSGDIVFNNNMLYGYVTTAATNAPKVTDPSLTVVNAVMRFPNAELAAKAAREIHTQITTVDDGAGIGTSETIDVLPNTLVSSRENSFDAGPEVAVNALTPHGDYLLYTWAQAPAAEKNWTAKAIAKAISLQSPLIDKFPAQPTKNQNGGQSAEFPMVDQDKVLIYAIPEQDDQAKLGDDQAVYGPRGMSHRSTNPPLTYKTLTETGSEHNAVAKTTVYRAADNAGAQRIIEDFSNDLASQGYTAAATPPGLPTATCVTKDTIQGTSHYCMIVNGRYVGEANTLDNKTEVDQLISAQYLILEQADQNA